MGRSNRSAAAARTVQATRQCTNQARAWFNLLQMMEHSGCGGYPADSIHLQKYPRPHTNSRLAVRVSSQRHTCASLAALRVVGGVPPNPSLLQDPATLPCTVGSSQTSTAWGSQQPHSTSSSSHHKQQQHSSTIMLLAVPALLLAGPLHGALRVERGITQRRTQQATHTPGSSPRPPSTHRAPASRLS